jgi:hypothetical protein
MREGSEDGRNGTNDTKRRKKRMTGAAGDNVTRLCETKEFEEV